MSGQLELRARLRCRTAALRSLRRRCDGTEMNLRAAMAEIAKLKFDKARLREELENEKAASIWLSIVNRELSHRQRSPTPTPDPPSFASAITRLSTTKYRRVISLSPAPPSHTQSPAKRHRSPSPLPDTSTDTPSVDVLAQCQSENLILRAENLEIYRLLLALKDSPDRMLEEVEKNKELNQTNTRLRNVIKILRKKNACSK